MQPVYVQPVVAYGFGGAAAVPQQWQQPQQPQQPQQWQQPQPQPQPQWQPQQPQQMVGMGGVPVGAVMPMGGIPPMGGMGGMPMMPVPQPESWQTVASRGAWVQVDGGLSCVSAGNDGSVWGVNSSQDIFRRAAGSGWVQVPGKLVQVSCSSFDRAVGVNASSQIFEFDGRDWRNIPGSAIWASEGRDGSVFCCNAQGLAFRLNPDRNTWTQLGGAGLTQIAVGDAENVACVAAGLGFRFTPHNNDWKRLPGDPGSGLTRVSISSGGRRIVVLAGDRAMAFDGVGAWSHIPAPPLASISVADGSMVGATREQSIFAMQLPAASSAAMPMGGMGGMGMGGMPMMPVPQPESWLTVASRGAWVQVDGGLSCVSAGNDGSVWGVNLSQDIFRRAAGSGWVQVPGKLVQVSCSSFDRAVGVNASSQIFEFDGRDWRNIPGSAIWASEGRDGSVFCCNAQGLAFRLNPDRNTWTQLGGAGLTQIAVGDAENVACVAAGLGFRFTPHNNDWKRLPGDPGSGLTRVSISSGGRRIVVLAGDRAMAFDGVGAWSHIPAPPLASISVADGSMVGATREQSIFAMQLPSA